MKNLNLSKLLQHAPEEKKWYQHKGIVSIFILAFLVIVLNGIYFVKQPIQGKVLGVKTVAGSKTTSAADQASLDAIWTAVNDLQYKIGQVTSNVQNLQQSLVTTTDQSALPSPTPPRYKYLLLENVTPCQVNQLGLDSWQLYQEGDFSNSNYPQTDPSCKLDATQQKYQNQLYGLTWAIFQKEAQ